MIFVFWAGFWQIYKIGGQPKVYSRSSYHSKKLILFVRAALPSNPLAHPPSHPMLSPTNFTRSANHNISSQTRSLHYTNCGSLLLSAHENGNLHTISTSTGQISKTIKLSNNGIRAMVPTHDPLSFLSSSLHTNFDVNYVSAYDNRYLRKFHGHIKPVTAISMNPTDDTFVTSSEDGTVLLFDLRSAHPTSKLALPGYAGNPVASFDKSGYVFGCMASSGETHEMKMYDPKAADAPFETFTTTNSNISDYIRANNVNDFNTEDINYMINGEWVDLKFSER